MFTILPGFSVARNEGDTSLRSKLCWLCKSFEFVFGNSRLELVICPNWKGKEIFWLEFSLGDRLDCRFSKQRELVLLKIDSWCFCCTIAFGLLELLRLPGPKKFLIVAYPVSPMLDSSCFCKLIIVFPELYSFDRMRGEAFPAGLKSAGVETPDAFVCERECGEIKLLRVAF